MEFQGSVVSLCSKFELKVIKSKEDVEVMAQGLLYPYLKSVRLIFTLVQRHTHPILNFTVSQELQCARFCHHAYLFTS